MIWHAQIYLELFVEKDTAAAVVSCEVQVGFLDVRIGDAPLLSGRLAQGVLSEVDWVLIDNRADNGESAADGRRRRP